MASGSGSSKARPGDAQSPQIQSEEIHDEERPPQYSDTRGASRSADTSLRPAAALANVQFQRYVLPQSTVSTDQSSTTTRQPTLWTDPAALSATLREQVGLPPKQLIRIRGSRPTKVDFDLKLNLMPLLVRPDDRWNYLKIPTTQGASAPRSDDKRQPPPNSFQDSLEDIARRFCSDAMQNKSLTLTRQITNLDTAYLEGQIRTLVSSLRYRGTVEVTFPVTYSKVIIRKGNEFAETWLGRLNTAIGALTGAKGPQTSSYTIEAVWPFATAPSTSGRIETGRECAVQSEVEWWAIWAGPIRNAVLGKTQGWVTVEDWTEVAMGLSLAEQKADWGLIGTE